ncbi:MAG: hypothetical protein ACTSYC_07425 [Promethearchaeota archaeon]
MTNLDHLSARYGQMISEEICEKLKNDPKATENFITKSLSVLQEQGLYAFVLFCESRGMSEIKGALKLKELTKKLLENDRLHLIKGNDLLKEISDLAENLDNLMLAIQVLEKSLIYARFHAKAKRKSLGE